jgi:hypothetical protein
MPVFIPAALAEGIRRCGKTLQMIEAAHQGVQGSWDGGGDTDGGDARGEDASTTTFEADGWRQPRTPSREAAVSGIRAALAEAQARRDAWQRQAAARKRDELERLKLQADTAREQRLRAAGPTLRNTSAISSDVRPLPRRNASRCTTGTSDTLGCCKNDTPTATSSSRIVTLAPAALGCRGEFDEKSAAAKLKYWVHPFVTSTMSRE